MIHEHGKIISIMILVLIANVIAFYLDIFGRGKKVSRER